MGNHKPPFSVQKNWGQCQGPRVPVLKPEQWEEEQHQCSLAGGWDSGPQKEMPAKAGRQGGAGQSCPARERPGQRLPDSPVLLFSQSCSITIELLCTE